MAEKSKKPAIRFAGFTDAWEQRKVSDIGEVITGSTPSTHHSEYYSEDGIPWVTPTDIVDNIIHDTPRKLSPLGEKVGRVVPANTILVTCIASIGKNTMLANAGSFNQQINGLVPDKKKYDSYFLLTESFHWSSKMKREAAAGTMQIVNKNEFSAIDTYVPEWSEQKAIGNYFRQLDNLITLHQRKYDKLVNVKKAMLEKMFPKDGADVPEIRFKGFTEAWEQRKFDKVFDGLQNNTLSRADLNYESGTVKNVHYGDVLIKFGDYIDASKIDLPYISDDTKADKFKSSFLQDGDIIIADTAEDDTVGKCTEIQGSEGLRLLSGLHTIACRPKEKYGPMFLGYYINSPAYHNQLKPLMQGIKVTSISKSALQNTDMAIPKSIDEQITIGKCFSYIDNLITLHQRKLLNLV